MRRLVHQWMSFAARAIAIVPVLLLIGCDGIANVMPEHTDTEASDEEKRGPNGGIMLEDGKFSVELTIFETGRPPQFRVFAYNDSKLLKPSQVDLVIELERLGGKVDRFSFKPEGDYLAGDGVVTEPHSFKVTVKAKYAEEEYIWSYESFEGRTNISAEAAREAGITTEKVGSAILNETIDVLGRINFEPGARVSLRGRFPGKVLEVFKTVGDRISKGDALARIESNKSLQVYTLESPLDGMILKRFTNPGDVATDGALFVVADPKRLQVDFHVYSSDLSRVQPGQSVKITTIEGGATQETKIATFLPVEEASTPIVLARAPLPNPDGRWIPGMTVRGDIVVSQRKVPMAVQTKALQRFRDFTVVFAKIGETYEVRMLDIGKRTETLTEVLGGIELGQEYAVENSFVIKADVEKSGASHDH